MNTVQKFEDRKIAVSLFSGAGGLDLGFLYLNYSIPVSIEIDKNAAFTYAQNFGCKIINAQTDLSEINQGETVIINDDIRKVTGQFILNLCEKISGTKKIDTLLGGPSCQSWSVAGKQLGKEDERGQMIYEYLRLLKELNPNSFLFENVKGIISKKFLQLFKNLVKEFEQLEYTVNYQQVNSWNYGAAQSRERVIVVGLQSGLNKMYEFPKFLSYKLVLKDVLSDLPEPVIYNKNLHENIIYEVSNKVIGFKGINHYKEWLKSGVRINYEKLSEKEKGALFIKYGITQFQNNLMNHTDKQFLTDPTHNLYSPILNNNYRQYSHEKMLLLSNIPEGGNWKNLTMDEAQKYMGKAIFSGGGKTGFLRKLSNEKPSPTILASMEQKFSEFCLPTSIPRRLSVRECMRIQSFSDWIIIYGNLSAQYRQIGNAVPVLMAFSLGKQLVSILDAE